MNILIRTITLSLAFALGAEAKELYVAPNGDDGVTYADNSIDAPWKSIMQGVYNLQAGDTLNIRGGTYTPTHTMRVRSDYDNRSYGGNPDYKMSAQTGTEEAPVTIQNYDNERVIIDLSNIGTFIHLDNKSHWTFDGLELINGGSIFVVGENSTTHHNTFQNLKATSTTGGDNWGVIRLVNNNADYTTIKNNVLVGPGTGSDINLNSSVIYLKTVKNSIIQNNEISNAPIGIYYKHKTEYTTPEEVNIDISYNFVHNTGRAAMELNTNYAEVRHNLFGENNKEVTTSNANGDPGGDYNVFEHNTFYSGGLFLKDATQSGDLTPGSIGNTVTNNLFLGEPLRVHPYKDTSHDSTSNHNLFNMDVTHINNGQLYSLSGWSSVSGLDTSSLEGAPEFEGGATPSDIPGFALTSSSPGYKSASTGLDMGANILQVGPQNTAPTVSTPMPPSNLIISTQ